VCTIRSIGSVTALSAPTTSVSRASRAAARLARLTDRERDVVALLGEGCSNAEVARRLHLTEATVKGYVSNALDKLGFTNRTQLGLLAREAGLGRK